MPTPTAMPIPPSGSPHPVLNAEQRRAVEHGIEAVAAGGACGPLLVIAGAGSGKTLTLASRVARLVAAGVDPSRILLLTFSRRAAAEMERRVGRALRDALGLAPQAGASRLAWCGTFHSVGARLLRAHAATLGLDPAFGVDDRSDSEDLMHLLRARLGHAASRSRFPQRGTCLAIHSRVVNACGTLDAVLEAHFPWCLEHREELRRLFAAYAEAKAGQHVLDFDDLLLAWQAALDAPSVAAAMRRRFDHVLVDEYQDTNRLQAAIVAALAPAGRNLTVVGDDAQSIYSFRAAEVRNILDFAARFDPPATVVALERNYRSTAPLLAASNAVIALAGERHAKTMWSDRAAFERPMLVAVGDESEQAAWVADRTLALRESGLALKRQAVLFRTASHSAALELELARRNIPFVKYGGLRFLEGAHVKDVLSIVRLAANPRGERAALRALQLVPGIGAQTAGRIAGRLRDAEDPVAAWRGIVAPPSAAAAWAGFVSLLDALRDDEAAWPEPLHAVERWYRPQLDRLFDEPEPRAADIAQLVRLAVGYPSRDRFLTELALDPPAATSDESGEPLRDEDWLVLSTIHSAKGQEWTAVSVLNAVDGCIPSDMATGRAEEIEEERRLLYVALTRARQHLHVLVPQRFYVTQQRQWGDRHVYGSISRFLPPEVRACFDEAGAKTGAVAHDGAAAESASIDITRLLRERWSC